MLPTASLLRNQQALLPPLSRLILMLFGWGTVGLVYTLSGLQDPARAFHLAPMAIDRWFRFDPGAIWVYLSFFLIVPFGYLAATPERTRWLTRAMVIAAAGAGLVYALFPTTMSFPPIPDTGFSAATLRLLVAYDTTVNCAPSLHVTLTALAVWALWLPARPFRNAAFALWGSLIVLSILQLYRHQFVDLLSGLVLALIAGWLARRLAPPVPTERPA